MCVGGDHNLSKICKKKHEKQTFGSAKFAIFTTSSHESNKAQHDDQI